MLNLRLRVQPSKVQLLIPSLPQFLTRKRLKALLFNGYLPSKLLEVVIKKMKPLVPTYLCVPENVDLW